MFAYPYAQAETVYSMKATVTNNNNNNNNNNNQNHNDNNYNKLISCDRIDH